MELMKSIPLEWNGIGVSLPPFPAPAVAQNSKWGQWDQWSDFSYPKLLFTSVPQQGTTCNFLCWCVSGDPTSRRLTAQSNCLEPYGNTGRQAGLREPAWGQALRQQRQSHKKQRTATSSKPRRNRVMTEAYPKLHIQRSISQSGETESCSFWRQLEKRGSKKKKKNNDPENVLKIGICESLKLKNIWFSNAQGIPEALAIRRWSPDRKVCVQS